MINIISFVRYNQLPIVENIVISKLVEILIHRGYQIEVQDNDDDISQAYSTSHPQIMKAIGHTDQTLLNVKSEAGTESWIVLVHGNGIDVVSDYGLSLDVEWMQNFNKWCDELEGAN